MTQINSYEDINGVCFGSSEADVIAVFGAPVSCQRNREQERELHFAEFIFRFEASSGALREFTLLQPSVGAINEHAIAWDDSFLRRIMAADRNLMDVLGFVVSLKLGIAISGFHENAKSRRAIHAFRYGDWDMFQNRMSPFKVPS